VATKAIIKPELLKWTRNRARVTVHEGAKAAGVAAEDLQRWEAGTAAPTLTQLRCLAAKYHFPLAVFYLPEPPADFAPLRDFRRLPDTADGSISANLAFHIRTAYERREVALEIHDDLRDDAGTFPLKAKLADNPETVGQAIRDFLGAAGTSQTKAGRQRRAFDYWRRRLEEHGVLVFVISGPHYSVDLEEMRGFAIAKDVLPVIVVNGKDYSDGGKCFTLLHELTHILLGESAISNGSGRETTSTAEEQIERFCDAVAAAALMPRRMIQLLADEQGTAGQEWDDDRLRIMARTMGVSREAVLLRLVALKRATWDFYNAQRARFQDEYQQAAEKKETGEKTPVPIKRSILLMSWNGRGYTRLVLRGYYDQRLTLNDVSSYLGAKVKHIPALERAAFQLAE